MGMKCYWDREGAASVGYDAVQAREGKPVLPWARPLGVVAGCPETPAVKENMAAKNWAAPAPRKTNQTQPAVSSGAHVNPARSSTNASMHHAAAHVSPTSSGGRPVTKPRLSAPIADENMPKVIDELKAKTEIQQEELQDLRLTLDGLEHERDYYFRKLREVEILCSTLQVKMDPSITPEKLIVDIQGILYAENDEDEPRVDEEEQP